MTDLPTLHVSDTVRDRDNPDATMVVVGLDTLRADAYELEDGGPTVADVNPEHPEDDDVVEVVFPSRTDMDLAEQKRYAYPRSRLVRVAPVHADEENEYAAAVRERLATLDMGNDIDYLLGTVGQALVEDEKFPGDPVENEEDRACWAVAQWCQEVGYVPDLRDFEAHQEVPMGFLPDDWLSQDAKEGAPQVDR